MQSILVSIAVASGSVTSLVSISAQATDKNYLTYKSKHTDQICFVVWRPDI